MNSTAHVFSGTDSNWPHPPQKEPISWLLAMSVIDKAFSPNRKSQGHTAKHQKQTSCLSFHIQNESMRNKIKSLQDVHQSVGIRRSQINN